MDMHYLELNEVSELIRTKKVSSQEVTSELLGRIKNDCAHLNSFIEVTEDIAMQQAKQADDELARDEHRGAMHGVPIALKDLVDMEGVATTAAMALRKNAIADGDSTVVRRLKDSGAVILGKLNMTEGAYGEHVPPYGDPINPWSDKIWAGASSSGSGVATASGLCFGALASDTGASIRIPSAINGVTGLKPTWGRVSRHRVIEFAGSLDHIGPICRSALDTGIMLDVMAGHDPLDPTSSRVPVSDYSTGLGADLKGMTIGIDRDWVLGNVDEMTQAAVLKTIEVLKDLGAKIVDINFPDPDEIIWDWFKVCRAQTAEAHKETFPSRRDEYGAALTAHIDDGLKLTVPELQEALTRREIFTGHVQALYEDIDLMICPVMGYSTLTLERVANVDTELTHDVHRFTCTFDMARNPTITLPADFADEGYPIGIQLVAAHFDERRLVQAGHAFQNATKWHKRHPFA